MNAIEKLRNLPRPVELVELPGGGSIHVRSLTLAELRKIDELSAKEKDTDERQLAMLQLMCAAAIAEPDGTPAFPGALSHETNVIALHSVSQLTPSQMKAIVDAIASRDKAKNS